MRSASFYLYDAILTSEPEETRYHSLHTNPLSCPDAYPGRDVADWDPV